MVHGWASQVPVSNKSALDKQFYTGKVSVAKSECQTMQILCQSISPAIIPFVLLQFLTLAESVSFGNPEKASKSQQVQLQ